MKKLNFRFKRYDDKFNVQLGKRFFDCYKIDLLDADEILFSSILNTKTGTIYSDEIFSVQIKDKSALFSSQHNSNIYLNGDFFCNFYIANPMRNLFAFTRQKHLITLNDDRIISVVTSPGKFSFKTHKLKSSFTEGSESIVKLNGIRYFHYNFNPEFEYNGEITFAEHIPMLELMFFLHFILIDSIYQDRKNES